MELTVGIYIRVSTTEQAQDGYSLTAQRERLKAFCKAQGWDSFKFYVEEGLSGRNTKRPVYQELMKDVENNRINVVLVYKLDRIMRSIGELDMMLKTLKKHNCGFKSATEPFDTTNPTGKLFMYVVAAFAQWESDVSSERIKMVLEEKVAKDGIWIGNVPYPFDKDEESKKLVSNKERTKVTLKMIDMVEKGYSANRISKYLTKTNNDRETWTVTGVLRILRNPALCGDTRWNDKVYKNTHEGIISRERFNKLQQILKDRTITRIREPKSICIFQGKIACPNCGKIMSANRVRRKRPDGTIYRNTTYRCNPCTNANLFNNTPVDTSFEKSLYRYMKNFNIKNLKNIEVKNETPHELKELEHIENQRTRYQRAWAQELITDDEFLMRMNETKDIYEKLKKKTKKIKTQKTVDVEAIEKCVFTFNETFRELSLEEKREFVSRFIHRIEFKLIPQPPKSPRNLVGKPLLVITNIDFY